MPIVFVQGANAAELAAKVADVLDTDVQPIGDLFIIGNATVGRVLCQAMGEADSTITDYDVIYSDNLSGLGAKLDTALAVANTSLMGQIKIVGDNVNFRQFVQVVVVGDQATGGGGGATLPAAGTTEEITTGTVSDLRMWAPKTIKDALPSAGSAGDLQTGTATVPRTWTAKAIHDEIARQITATP